MNCPYFGTCGGCSLPGVPYAQQLAAKQKRLSGLLRRPVPPLIASPRQEAFRQKAAFVFGVSRGRLVMGHYAAESRTVVPVEVCPVHAPRANRLAFALRNALQRPSVNPILLRHVLIRATDDDSAAVVMLVVLDNHKSLRAPIRSWLDSPDAPDGFLVNVNDRPGPFMVGKETLHLAGSRHVLERALGPKFLVAPDSFFQTNVGAAAELLKLVLAAVGDAPRVLDLYSGNGLFTVPLAAAGATVTAVEESRQSTDDARTNLRLNKVPSSRVKLIAGRVEESLSRLPPGAFDAAIVDPPRQGCAPGVWDAITRHLRPRRLVCVSCEPTALADDLPKIEAAGYRVEGIQPVDMFPHTGHIETVVWFTAR